MTQIVALGFAAVLAMLACEGSDGTDGDVPPPAPTSPSSAAGRCPEAGPPSGSTCSLPEGTTCLFGPCGAPIAQCSAGVWRYSSIDHAPSCPAEVPDIDQVCPECWPASATCTYGACTGPDASANLAVASCGPEGKWAVAALPCDAGADVQVD